MCHINLPSRTIIYGTVISKQRVVLIVTSASIASRGAQRRGRQLWKLQFVRITRAAYFPRKHLGLLRRGTIVSTLRDTASWHKANFSQKTCASNGSRCAIGSRLCREYYSGRVPNSRSEETERLVKDIILKSVWIHTIRAESFVTSSIQLQIKKKVRENTRKYLQSLSNVRGFIRFFERGGRDVNGVTR